jgi:hypothetical protein
MQGAAARDESRSPDNGVRPGRVALPFDKHLIYIVDYLLIPVFYNGEML